MTAQTAVFLTIVVVTSQLGDISMSFAMKRIGEVKEFDPLNLLRVMRRAFRIKWMWIGVGLMTVAFFALLMLLSWANVSLVVPATAASYLIGAIGARFLLKEHLTFKRWIGVIIVCVGVALVCA